MVMVRFTADKLRKGALEAGLTITDTAGKVIGAIYETPYGYALNDGENKATAGTITFQNGRAVIDLPEHQPTVVKRFLFFWSRFPKGSPYAKLGSMRFTNLQLFYNGQLAARVSKIRRSNKYAIDVWKGANAVQAFLIALAIKDLTLHRKS